MAHRRAERQLHVLGHALAELALHVCNLAEEAVDGLIGGAHVQPDGEHLIEGEEGVAWAGAGYALLIAASTIAEMAVLGAGQERIMHPEDLDAYWEAQELAFRVVL